jgi:hypothetical protein
MKNESINKNIGSKSLLKSQRIVLEVIERWRKEKDRLKVASYISEKYSLLLSRNQIDAIIRKGRKLNDLEAPVIKK